MVDISSQNNKINITVSSSGNTANTNVTPDYAQYYSEKSKEWAISNRIVDNTDYSSKYYANESKKQADISTAKASEVIASGNNAVSNIESARDNAITDITNQESLSVDNVNTAGATQVALATEQATIATNKTSEVIESGNTALSNIDTAKNNAITSITNQETTSKTSLIDEGATQVGLIQNEGATQVANVQSTGFYMRDDKLYFINSQGEETEFKLDDIELNNPYSLFDSKYSPNTLNNLSWLKSEGQWNAKAVYTDAYDKLLKVYNGTETVEGLSVKLSTETYTDYDFVLNTADETFRLPLLNGSESLIGDKYTNYQIGPSGQEYTATHNGYVSVIKSVGIGIVNLYNSTQGHTNTTSFQFYISAETVVKVSIKVNRGDKFIFQYTAPTTNSYSFMILRHNKGNGSLYFYVGETVQNANLIDAGRIEEILPTKTDKFQAAQASFPSNKYIDLTLGASGSTYTAPANGFVTVFGNFGNANGFLHILDITGDRNNCSVISKAGSGDWTCAATLPIRKGHTFGVSYNYNPTSVSYGLFRFYYAEGEV